MWSLLTVLLGVHAGPVPDDAIRAGPLDPGPSAKAPWVALLAEEEYQGESVHETLSRSRASEQQEVEAVSPSTSTTSDEGLRSTRDLVVTEAAAKRPFHVSGAVDYRMLAVSDEDPRNDRYTDWRLRGDYEVWDKLFVFLRFRAIQLFTAEPDESGFLLLDTMAGFDYFQELKLDLSPVLGERTLKFDHRLGFFFPSSRESRAQDLLFAPYALERVQCKIIPDLILTVDLWFRYHFHEYAERAGLEGGMNTQMDFGGSLGLEYVVFSHDWIGELALGASVSDSYEKAYPSNEEFESELSSRTLWHQEIGWGVYASVSPLDYLTVVAGFEDPQIDVLRNGILTRPARYFGNRDDMEFFVQVLGKY